MKDETEGYRRARVNEINSAVESNSDDEERIRLMAIHGPDNVWNMEELCEKFTVVGFMAPFSTPICTKKISR